MNLNELEPGTPEYEAALDAAQAEEDAANDNADGAAAPQGDDDDGEGTENAPAATAAEEPAAAAPAAATPEKPANPSGVLSKDGKTVLSYAVLQAARRDKASERDARLAAEAEAERLRKEIEDLRAGRKPAAEAADPLDEALADAAEDFPALTAVAKVLKETRDELAALKGAGKTAAAPAAQEAAEEDADPVQSAIDAVPALATWQATDPEKFRRAQQLDVALSDSRKWAGKPMAERFAHVARLVADEYDIQIEDEPAPQRTTRTTPNRADPQEVISRAARQTPNTLSDMKGGAAAGSEERLDRMPPQRMLARMQEMTDQEIEDHLAKFG